MGPILVFPRIQPFGSYESSSLGKVYSRQATESLICENSSVSFVMKYCPTPTVVRNPASVQNLLNLSCCDNFLNRSLYLCNRYTSCAESSFKSMFVFITLGTNNGSDCPATTSRPVLTWQVSHSLHKSETAPSILSWLTEIIVLQKQLSEKQSFNRSLISAEAYWQFSTTVALSVPRDNGLVARKTGCPLSSNFIIICSATLSHSPCGLYSWVEYHFFSDSSQKNDHFPGENLLA